VQAQLHDRRRESQSDARSNGDRALGIVVCALRAHARSAIDALTGQRELYEPTRHAVATSVADGACTGFDVTPILNGAAPALCAPPCTRVDHDSGNPDGPGRNPLRRRPNSFRGGHMNLNWGVGPLSSHAINPLSTLPQTIQLLQIVPQQVQQLQQLEYVRHHQLQQLQQLVQQASYQLQYLAQHYVPQPSLGLFGHQGLGQQGFGQPFQTIGAGIPSAFSTPPLHVM
jgi:hypothetical protein